MEEFVDIAYRLGLLPVDYVGVGHDVLLRLDVLGLAELGSFP